MSQNDQEIKRVEREASHEMSVTVYNRADLQICWQKYDRKSKKVNFIIRQHGQEASEKATVSTIEGVGEKIEALQYKLDQVSMGIATEIETEKVHFECKSTSLLCGGFRKPQIDSKTRCFVDCSDERYCRNADLDECAQDAARARSRSRLGILGNTALQQRRLTAQTGRDESIRS